MPVIVIVASTALRDALEDHKRHQADKIQNLSKVTKYDGPNFNFTSTKKNENSIDPLLKQNQINQVNISLCSLVTRNWIDTTWSKLGVGDFVYLKNNEPIPADLLIISTSEPECTCFVETKNLDGETNLKIKRGVTELSYINTPDDISSLKCHIDAEMPNPNLYTFNGAIVIPDFTKEEPNVIPIGPSGIALRGCTLR
jgi:phospholipid-translocating ATPase